MLRFSHYDGTHGTLAGAYVEGETYNTQRISAAVAKLLAWVPTTRSAVELRIARESLKSDCAAMTHQRSSSCW